jgi:DNA-binding IclR family transcriptional regulator
MNKPNIIPALDKAVSVLEYLGKTEHGASQIELAKALDITASTCYRILQTLLARNWVCQKPGNLYDVSRGMLGATIKMLNSATRFECLQPVLDRLAFNTGLSCKLSIRRGDRQVSILRAESPAPMTVSGKVGANFPLLEGATGATLVLDEPEDKISRLLAECPENLEEKRHKELIAERINSLRKFNYCMNAHPNRWNIETMAAPVKDRTGKVIAVITILGFASDFSDENIKIINEHLQNAVTECSQIL